MDHEGAPAGELLGVVGDGAQPSGDPEGALRGPRGDAGGDESPGARDPVGPGRGRGRHRGRRGPRRRRHVERSRQRVGSLHVCAGAAAGRVDQRVRPHDRVAERPDRGDGRPPGLTCPRADPARRSRLGERPLLPLPRRDGLRCGRGGAGRAAIGSQALRRPSAVRVRRLRHRVAALRPQPSPVLRAVPGRVGGRRRLPLHLPQHQPLHVPRQPTARPRPRGHARAGPRLGHGANPRLHPHDADHRVRARRTDGTSAPRAGPTTARISPSSR